MGVGKIGSKGRPSQIPDGASHVAAGARATTILKLDCTGEQIVTAVWVTKLIIHPARPQTFADFFSRLAIGGLIPPWFVAATSLVFVVSALILAWTCPSAEDIEDWSAHYRKVAARARD